MALSRLHRDTGGMMMAEQISAAAQLRVYLVEDAPQIRERLERMIRAIPQLEVVGSADNAAEAIAEIEALRPDAVVVDIQLVSGSGLDVLWRVREKRRDIHSIVLTNFASSQHRKAAQEAGSDHFLDKTQEFAQIAPILKGWRDAKTETHSALTNSRKT